MTGGLASLSHSNGVLILIPLALLYLYGPRPALPTGDGGGLRPRYRLRRDALWLLAVPLGLIAYMGYLWVIYGSAVQPFIAEQKIYHHWFAGPFGALAVAFMHLPHDLSLVVQNRVRIVGLLPQLPGQARATGVASQNCCKYGVGAVVVTA